MRDPATVGRPHFAGEFRWEVLLCRIFENNLSPEAGLSEPRPADRTLAAFIAGHAATAADAFPIRFFPPAQSAAVGRTLFHEKVHYWQLLFCPLVQSLFLQFLDRLFIEAERLGARTQMIASQGHFRKIGSEELAEDERSLRSHFARPALELAKIKSLNEIDPRRTAMPFLMLPHKIPRLSLPGYGALMVLDDGSESFFPFTGPYLWEAAAFLSEALFAGEAPLRLRRGDAEEGELYLGAWEFWCRVHEARAASPEDLALGFLAAVDLALTSDIVDPEQYDSDYNMEIGSIPYRFGKIAYSAQGFQPFNRAGREAAAAVADWQEQFCRWRGWPSPTNCVRKSVFLLTSVLAATTARDMPNTPAGEQALRQFFGLEPGGNWSIADLEPVWKLIRLACSRGAPAIGQPSLGAMLNACIYRLSHPGEAALPHLYASRLSGAFPLPIIVAENEYCIEQAGSEGVSAEPYPLGSTDLLHDVIGLIAVRPLRKSQTGCGFIEERLECGYVRSGLGCPQKLLDERQRGVRRDTGLDDWCHWLLRSLLLATAPTETQTRWEARFRNRGS
jgi:hypothetical protein